jgi:fatty-acyl-CoA synthase
MVCVPEAGPKVRGGWLNPGDLGSVDADGYVRLAGRATDLIIRGDNIDPQVIEDALLEHPDVAAAAAVGRPDPHAGEVPVAYVILAAGARVAEGESRARAAARLPEAAGAPKHIDILDAILSPVSARSSSPSFGAAPPKPRRAKRCPAAPLASAPGRSA